MLEIVLGYAANGWRVFPLHEIKSGRCSCGKPCASPGKHPRTLNGVDNATTDEDQIRQWWRKWPTANVGIATGRKSGLLVADFDPKQSGLEYRDELIDQIPGLNESLIVSTGGGGFHHYFKFPAVDIGCPNKINGYGFDIRGNGGYVVAPPSNHKSGNSYEWLDADADDLIDYILDCPEALTDLIKTRTAAREEFEALPGVTIPALDKDEIAEIVGALQFVRPLGDDWLHIGMALHERTGGTIQGFQLWDRWAKTEEVYSDAPAKNHYARWRSFNDNRLDGITISSLFSKASANGWSVDDIPEFIIDLPVTIGKETEEDPATSESPPTPAKQLNPLPAFKPLFEIMSVGELMAEKEADRVALPIWGDHVLFKHGLLLIAGEPKIGKSALWQSFAAHACTGREFMGLEFDKPCRVLWFQDEIHKDFLKRRMEPMLNNFGRVDGQNNLAIRKQIESNFFTINKPKIRIGAKTNNGHLALMRKAVEKIQPDIICFDPMVNFHSGNENDNAEMNEFIDALVSLTEVAENGSALVLIHHVNKGKEKEYPFESIRGASAIRGSYDSGIVLRRNKDNKIECHYETRNGESPAPHLLEWNASTWEWKTHDMEFQTLKDGTTQGIKIDLSDRQLDCIAMLSGAGLSYGQWEQRIINTFKKSERTARAEIAQIRESGHISEVRTGKELAFFLNETGRENLIKTGKLKPVQVKPTAGE